MLPLVKSLTDATTDEGDDGDEAYQSRRHSTGYRSEDEGPRPVGDLAPALIKWLLEEERSLLTKIDQSIAEN